MTYEIDRINNVGKVQKVTSKSKFKKTLKEQVKEDLDFSNESFKYIFVKN